MADDSKNLDIVLEKAWIKLLKDFPFENYIRNARKVGYFTMVKKVVQWSNREAKVLDFGAGPCDKTALFSLVGMDVTAYDDFQDAWHKLDGVKEKVLCFSKSIGIEYYFADGKDSFPFPNKQYDIIMAQDVLEHLHSSPRVLINRLLPYLKPSGILVITVPNAANLRKRIHLLMGRTNYNKYEYYYWYPGLWRGHVREYVRNDLILLNQFLGLELLELSTYHLQLDVLPSNLRPLFVLFSTLFPRIRDSWMLISRKPENWAPRLGPNPEQFQNAFGGQYFNYSGNNFNWEE